MSTSRTACSQRYNEEIAGISPDLERELRHARLLQACGGDEEAATVVELLLAERRRDPDEYDRLAAAVLAASRGEEVEA